MTTPEEAEATMDAFGEAFMKMVRERLSLQVLAPSNSGNVRIALTDTHPVSRHATVLSVVEINVLVPSVMVSAKNG